MNALFILATHGDEGFSVPVFERLENKFPKNKYAYEWIIGNPKAYEKSLRFVDVDMNRNAPGNIRSKLYEEQRAAELIAIGQNYDVVIDIHGAKSDCGVCSIVSFPTLTNLLLASQLNCKNNIIWYSSASDNKGPLNQHIGVPSIELECGPKESTAVQQELYETVANFLQKQGTISYPTGNKWYTVSSKLNKSNFEGSENWEDFSTHNTMGEQIIPFLSKNTYSDGTFYRLNRITFEKQFGREE